MSQVEGGGVPAGNTAERHLRRSTSVVAMGGMGEVYIGQTLIQTGDKVAIKMILPEHANNELILDLFRREASTLHNLYHPAIVRYYVFSVDPVLNRPYLTMEFAGGPALGDRLKDGGPLNEHEMTVMRRRVAGGLHAAHELGIVHRDMSPDNIILVDGDVEKTKIIDFGIAKSTSQEGTLIGSGFAGKLNYVSPEQLGLGDGEVTGKSDIYSLGLVFAEAVIGHPLPMGGSQVEVIDKRRSVPDLSEVPIWIRPLIESMIQPNPADRPADMDAVATWTNTGGAPAASSSAAAPVHPRDRRKQEAKGDKGDKKGLPWLWIGLGGGALAAAAVGAVVMTGDPSGTAGNKQGTGVGGSLVPGAETFEGTLSASASSVIASNGQVGETYSWASETFRYGGSASDLIFDVDGTLPAGLTFQTSSTGAAQIFGTPTAAGTSTFEIVVRSPEGDEVRQSVQVVIENETQIAIATPPTQLSGTGGSDSSTPTLGTTGGSGSVPVLGQPTTPTLQVPGSDGGTPTVGGGTGSVPVLGQPSTPTLQVPGTGGSTPSVGTGTGGTPVLGGGSTPTLGSGGGTITAPTVQTTPDSTDPSLGSTEPTVQTGSPGFIQAPGTATGGSPTLSTGGSDTFVIPRTGAGVSQPSGGGDSGGTVIANIPSQENQPPTIQDKIPGTLSAGQGDDLNVRLGSFFDEEGPRGLKITIDGDLPVGMSVRLADGGVAQLFGKPAEFGDFSFKVAAVDPQGLVSRPIAVALSIKRSPENSAVRDYILGYNGGDCFLSRPVELGPSWPISRCSRPRSRRSSPSIPTSNAIRASRPISVCA